MTPSFPELPVEVLDSLSAEADDVFLFPTSFAQQRLWLLDQFEPDSALYNIPAAVRLSGRLQIAAFERALNVIVDRHETLRTTFIAQDGQPMQVIHPEMMVSLPLIDLEALPAADREAEALRLAHAEALRPFDLSRGPLLRMTLLRLSQAEHVVLLTLHHIIADGWSMGVLIREIATLYQAFVRRYSPSLPDLPIQYADYAVWQREWLAPDQPGSVMEQQLVFWKEQLSNPLPPVLELPTDRPRPAVQTYGGAARKFTLAKALVDQLRALGRAEDATLFMVLLTGFQTLLYRYSGQTDIAVGTPIAGRTQAETEHLIGCFVNTLVLRSRLAETQSLRDLLHQVRRVTLAAYDHQDFPFERLVEELQPTRDLSYSPLFQVMFVLQNTPVAEVASDLTLQPVATDSSIAQFDLTLTIEDNVEGLSATFGYNIDLFDAATIERLGLHFEQVLTALVTAPEQALGAVPLLTAAERAQLATWNATTVDYPPTSLPALVAAQAARTPQAVAVEHQGQTLTYAQLVVRVHQLAHLLRAHGVETDVLVALAVERSPELLIGALAILAAGGAYVPLDPAYPPQRLQAMLADARPPLLLTQPVLRDQWAEFPGTVLVLDEAGTLAAQQPTTAPAVAYDPAQLAYLIYTSGSTGTPKGVAVPHGALTNFLHSMVAQPGLTARDTLLAVTTIAFDIAGLELWGPLLVGARVVLATREEAGDGALLAAALERSGATVLQATPVSWRLLLAAGWAPRPGVRRWCGGEALPRDLGSALLTDGGTLWNLYGPTETTIWSATGPVAADGGITVGRPIANTQLYVLDAQLAPVPVGVVGEIYIGGTGVARGYNGRPELTATRFVPDALSGAAGARLYWTGDLGRWTADGELVCLGRTDQQVKVRGYRIELGEIETVLRQHPAVTASVVVARADGGGEQQLVGYVVSATLDGEALARELRAWLQERLPAYMVPAAWLRLDALPLTPNGKVDRRALPAVAVAPTVAGGDAPRTEAEALLAGIWAEVLHVERVGIHDNFFELGGHSLRATQVLARVREVWGQAVPLRTLFAAPTVAELAAVLTAAGTEDGSAPPPLVAQGEDVGRAPLSFAQERFWVIEQLTPGSTAYMIPLAVRLHGVLDLGALEQALAGLVARHVVLRTRVVVVGGVAQQEVVADLRVPLTVVDLREVDAEAQAAALAQAMAGITAAPFELEVGPLLRGGVVRLGAQEQVLVLAFHHSVADGWSLGVALRELAAGYTAAQTGAEPALEALPVQYTDYARWQRAWMQGEVLARELAVWQAQLAGVPALELPTDRPRPPVPSFAGAVLPVRIERELTDALQALSRTEGVTLFMTLLAGWQTLLGRWSGQTDFAVGVPIAGRSSRAVEELIGCFVNTLVLRADLHGAPSWRTLLRRVRTTTLTAFAHQELPFERLVDALAVERDLSRHPLFQVAFALQNVPTPVITTPGLTLTVEPVPQTTAKFDLTLLLEETDDGLVGSLEYATDLFDAATVARLVAQYTRLLHGLVRQTDTGIGTTELLSAEEWAQVVTGWNATATAYPRTATIHALFAAQAAATPEAVALVWAEQQLTYGELERRSNQLAHELHERGVGPEVPVALYLERSPELIVGLLGILKAGGCYVPLDPAYPAERIQFMLEDAGVSLLLTQSHYRDRIQAMAASTQILNLDTDWSLLADQPVSAPVSATTAENLAYVIYTSGSTGRPKGVRVPHRGVVRLVKETNYARLTADETFLQLAPISFDASTLEVWGSLLNGARLVIYPADLPSLDDLGAVITRYGVTTLWLTAGLFHQMVDHQLEALTQLRQLLAGGDVLSPAHVARVLEAGGACQVINGYGPTENTTFTCCYPMRQVDEVGAPVSIGRPIANTRVYVLDQQMQPQPIGVPGELYIAGDGLARDYLNRPDLTATRFVPDPFDAQGGARLYRTGDLVRWLADGRIEFIKRIDQQVKIRGFRIELGEIEAALSQHDGVQEAVVVAREDTQVASGSVPAKRLVAYVVPAPNAEPTGESLREYLQDLLPAYMVPSLFVLLPELPLTPNGKVDRKALPAPEQIRSQTEASFVAPRTAAEETLATIWASVLGVEQVGVHDNFFALGGDSILGIQVVARANQVGLGLTPRQLFQHQTVAALARVVGSAPLAQAEQGIVAGAVPLTPIQHWFFDQQQPDPHHFNQALMLEVRQPLDPQLLQQTIGHLLEQHDALRMRFEHTESGWRQVNADLDPDVPFRRVDLTGLDQAIHRATIERIAAETQASLDLTSGPLLRVVLFDGGSVVPSRLLIVIHHLVVDNVSWRVVLEDLQTAYQQLTQGESVQLPAKTSSFRQWSQQLLSYSEAPELRAELEYWLSQPWERALPLPTDLPGGTNAESDAQTCTVALSADETRALLQEVPHAYTTQINDVLLTALAHGCATWTGSSALLVDLEGHGREDLFAGIDLSRTVGWFTSIFPVLVDGGDPADPGAALKSVKEQLRRIPSRGLGYGVLRYLGGAAELEALPRPDLSFNYLGQVDQSISEATLFAAAQESSGPDHSSRTTRAHLVEVNGFVAEGRLILNWTYNAALHRRATVEQVAQSCLGALRALIAHCLNPEAGGFTPSDFPEAALSQDALDELIADLTEFDEE